ncbi:MAG: 2-amino-4-hydroxy-6-hydroxymethyldihydropteridine diphosphokinase [Deltaproteobacteria bacterium]|nr:2-amino-4-hydroxy-6-hydroxymethyldihydropteridine diphosphokinase [Deltaproteobacteria bacterium]
MHVVAGLGANLGSREANLRAAVALSAREAECRVVALSSIYQTEPVGPPQPRYLNAAMRIETGLPLATLLDRFKAIEHKLGREPSEHWGARIIDLDLLWSDSVRMQTPQLTVPHPWLEERTFALTPLLEVAPELAPQYARKLQALGPEPERVATLYRQPRWRVRARRNRYLLEIRALDRYDAVCHGLSRLARRYWRQRNSAALKVREVRKECKEGDECRVFIREALEQARSGFRYGWPLVSKLDSGRVRGRLVGYSGRPLPIEIADVDLQESDNEAVILLSWPVVKFNQAKFL